MDKLTEIEKEHNLSVYGKIDDINYKEKIINKPKKVFDHACDSDRYALYTHNKNNASGIYRIRRL